MNKDKDKDKDRGKMNTSTRKRKLREGMEDMEVHGAGIVGDLDIIDIGDGDKEGDGVCRRGRGN